MPPPPRFPKKEAEEGERTRASPSSMEDDSHKYDPDGDIHRYLDFSEQEPLPVNSALPMPPTHEDAAPSDAEPSAEVSWDLDVLGPMIEALSNARVDSDDPQSGSSNSLEDTIEPTFMQFLPGQLDCSACMLLRELMHTNGRENITLAIHGDLGVFYHAIFSIEEMIDIGVSNHNYFYLDVTGQSYDWMRTFMIQYNMHMLDDGCQLVRDTVSAFIDALCSGISNASARSLPPVAPEPAGTTNSTPVVGTSAAGTSNSGMVGTEPAATARASNSARASQPAGHNAARVCAHPAVRGTSNSTAPRTPTATVTNSTVSRTPKVETHEAGPSQADVNTAAESSRRGKAVARFIPSAAPPRSSRTAPVAGSSRSHLVARTDHDFNRRRTLDIASGEGTSRSAGVQVGAHRVRIPKTAMAIQRERTGNMRLEDLNDYFHLPIARAARELNICSTALKHICRRNGMRRWPQRKINSIDKKVAKLEEKLRNCRSSERAAEILAKIEKLKEKRARLCKGERDP